MKRLICATIAAFLVGGTVAAATPSQGKSRKHAKQDRSRYDSGAVRARSGDGRARGALYLRAAGGRRRARRSLGERAAAGRRGQRLSRAVGRRAARSGRADLERRLPVLPPEYRRGVFDGHAVIYNTRSNVIVDVAVLF